MFPDKLPDWLKIFNLIWKLSRKTQNSSDKLETFQTIWKVSRPAGYQYKLETSRKNGICPFNKGFRSKKSWKSCIQKTFSDKLKMSKAICKVSR